MCLLVLAEILVVLVKTLTTDGKYRVLDWENLPLPIRMQFSEKRRTFSESLATFAEAASNVKHFEREDYRHRQSIFEIRECEKRG